MLDERSAPMDNNVALRLVLEYGALPANMQNRLAGVTFPECLPEKVVDALKEAGREVLVAEHCAEPALDARRSQGRVGKGSNARAVPLANGQKGAADDLRRPARCAPGGAPVHCLSHHGIATDKEELNW